MTASETASGTAWSEDPSGHSLAQVRVDIDDGPQLLLGRAGPVRAREPLESHTLTEIRDRVLAAERQLGEPARLNWRIDDQGALSADNLRPIDEPLPWQRMEPYGHRQWGWDGYHPHRADRWSRANAGEVFPGVMTPLTWSLTGAALDRAFAAPWGRLAAGRRFVALFDGYVYFNLGLILELLGDSLGMRTSDFLLAVGGPEAAQAGAQASAMSGAASASKSERPNYLRLLRHLPFLIWRALVQRWLPLRWPTERKRALQRREALRAFDADAASDREIMRVLLDSGDFAFDYVEFLMQCQTAAFGQVQFLLWLSEDWLGDRSLALRLLQGLPHVLTAESNIELWRLAQRAAADPPSAARVAETQPDQLLDALAAEPETAWLADALHQFLADHGHRTTAELELSTPRWVEQPAPLLATFREYVLHPGQTSPQRLRERQVADRRAAQREARDALTAHPLERLLPGRWLLYRLVVHDAQTLQPLRENPKYVLMQITLEQRRLYLQLGERWTRSGALDAAEDVFWLLGDEAQALSRETSDDALRARIRSRVRRRRRQHDQWAAQPPPPLRDLHGQPQRETEPAAQPAQPAQPEREAETTAQDAPSAQPERESETAAQDAPPAQPQREALELRGIAASAGTARGRARIAASPEEGRQLIAGEILVARFTDPGWTPIFPLAAAVVTEIGGMLSHGAVVAREYGIPAVVNVPNATTALQTGDLIEVDGSTGQIRTLP